MTNAPVTPPIQVTPEEARAIAKDAYIYGFPVVDHYRVLHAYFVDTANPEYKAPFNTLASVARVYTPDDHAIQTPNSDTPYSMLGMDLRAEPLVLTIPPIAGERYFSVQFIDLYTHNFAYVGSRTTGNGGGAYLVAGPQWQGEVPPGIARVIRSETELTFAIFRTQLIEPADIDNVRQIQAGYQVQPLSTFLGQPAPAAAVVSYIRPLAPDAQKTSLAFFDILSFALRFCPTHPSEAALRARFARLGIGRESALDTAALPAELAQAVAQGMADGWAELAALERDAIATGKVTAGDLFGTREYLQNNYLYRFAGAVLGIFGNSKQEAMYPVYRTDADGQPMDGATSRYQLRFAPGHLPPVRAFWSLTMYNLPASLLVANPINRYLINSPMASGLRRDADGGLTIDIQHESPGGDRETNWLPAPNGPFWTVLRLYWPADEALDGRWTPPKVQRVP